MKQGTAIITLILAGLLAPAAMAADGQQLVQNDCAGCHALERPAYEELGIAERAERKGPPLYYAGNKFRREWLGQWLQDPERLRPAGIYPHRAAQAGAEFDEINPETLIQHPRLDPAEASAAAEFLMTLRAHDDLIEATSYEPGTIAARMGQLNFSKFNGCDSCHSDEPGYGGVSGPELYTAWQRLQPRFIASYIADPVAWDPHTLMPASDLNEAAVERLSNYLRLIGEE